MKSIFHNLQIPWLENWFETKIGLKNVFDSIKPEVEIFGYFRLYLL